MADATQWTWRHSLVRNWERLRGPLGYAALAGLFASCVALLVITLLVGIPVLLYVSDVGSILFAAFVGGAVILFTLKEGGARIRPEVGIGLAVVTFGYMIEASRQLDSKNSLRQAIIADVAAISETMREVRIFDWVADRPPAGLAARDILAPGWPSDEARIAARYRLERLTIFTSAENYFAAIDAAGPRIADLPNSASVSRFYSLLRGSRDVARLQQHWAFFAFASDDAGIAALNERMARDVRILRCVLVSVVEAATAATNANSPGPADSRIPRPLADLAKQAQEARSKGGCDGPQPGPPPPAGSGRNP